MVPRGKYLGERLGEGPASEAEHFIRCPACKKMFASEHFARQGNVTQSEINHTECYMRKLTFGTTFFVALVAASVASAQGTVRGAQDGAAAGDRAAGPVGGVVGGAVGAATGTVGGILWSSTDYSCSRCEDVHRFWPHNHGTKNSRGKEIEGLKAPGLFGCRPVLLVAARRCADKTA